MLLYIPRLPLTSYRCLNTGDTDIHLLRCVLAKGPATTLHAAVHNGHRDCMTACLQHQHQQNEPELKSFGVNENDSENGLSGVHHPGEHNVPKGITIKMGDNAAEILTILFGDPNIKLDYANIFCSEDSTNSEDDIDMDRVNYSLNQTLLNAGLIIAAALGRVDFIEDLIQVLLHYITHYYNITLSCLIYVKSINYVLVAQLLCILIGYVLCRS